jgi:hypothetical protein
VVKLQLHSRLAALLSLKYSRYYRSSRLASRAGPQRGSRVADPGRIAALGATLDFHHGLLPTENLEDEELFCAWVVS